MKYLVLICDGMADEPIEELGGRTPIEVAKTPHFDKIAREGQIGNACFTPSSLYPGSDVANMSILGYDPLQYHTGRAPLEAANMDIELKTNQVAFRCNFITATEETLVDFSAGHISSTESHQLINVLNSKLGSSQLKFYPGVGYRHILVVTDENIKALTETVCIPPHDLIGKKFIRHLPKGKGAEFLKDLMQRSRAVLEAHDVNRVRIDLKENPANMIWLWGQGTRPEMPSFKSRYGLNGSVISAVDLINGLGRVLGLEVIRVPGATGYYDTNYKGKAEYGLKSLKTKDFVLIHVEAADEAGHNGDLRAKIKAIEDFDHHVLGTVLEAMKGRDDFRLLVCPDHATPIHLKTHTHGSVLFGLYGKGISPAGIEFFNEKTAAVSNLVFDKGHELMGHLLNG